MPYTPKQWVDEYLANGDPNPDFDPNTDPALEAANIRTIEEGIETAETKADSAQNAANTAQSTADGAQTTADGKADAGHDHDDRYYTESEMDTALSGKSDTGHGHAGTEVSVADAGAYYSAGNVEDILAEIAPKLENPFTATFYRGGTLEAGPGEAKWLFDRPTTLDEMGYTLSDIHSGQAITVEVYKNSEASPFETLAIPEDSESGFVAFSASQSFVRGDFIREELAQVGASGSEGAGLSMFFNGTQT